MLFKPPGRVGLKSGAGTLMLGRQTTPYHNTLVAVADPFATGYAGTIKNTFPDWGTNVRTNNTVMYASPDVRGWNGDVAYSFGEQAGSEAAGRQVGTSFGTARPAGGALAYNHKNTTWWVRRPRRRDPWLGQQKALACQLQPSASSSCLLRSARQGFQCRAAGQYRQPLRRRATDRLDRWPRTLPLYHASLDLTLMHRSWQGRPYRLQQGCNPGAWAIVPGIEAHQLVRRVWHISNRTGAGYTWPITAKRSATARTPGLRTHFSRSLSALATFVHATILKFCGPSGRRL